MNINELFSVRESVPDKFWGDLSDILLGECRSDKFLEILRGLTNEASAAFLTKKMEGVRLPYHIGYCVQDDDLQFRYFVQIIAQGEGDIAAPKHIITGILPFPGQQCHTFRLRENGDSAKCVDVFAPHMIDRYARRAYRMPDDIEMPNTWHKTKRAFDVVDFNENEVERLFKLVGKFFAHNKVSRLCSNKKALSSNEQGVNSDDQTCLWIDGLTYCKSFCGGQVLLHKTFLPYWKDASAKDDAYLGEDQMKAIADELACLYKEAAEAFPRQYGTAGSILSQFVNIYRWIAESLRPVSSVQERAWQYLYRWERGGLISISGSEPPRFDYKELSSAASTLQSLSQVTDCGVDERVIAKSVLAVFSSLWWHLRDFESWYKENGRMAVLREPEGLQVIRLMRGMNLRNVILSESELLSKTYVVLDSIMSN